MNITIFANELIPGKLYKANKNIYHAFGYQAAVKINEVFMLISQTKLEPDESFILVEEWETKILLNQKLISIVNYKKDIINLKVSQL